MSPLDASGREAFAREGWVRLPGLVPPDLCATVRSELAPLFERTGAGRLLNAWEVSGAVCDVAVLPVVAAVVEDLLGGPAFAFQTLDFRRGTEQEAHVDSQFFDTLPPGGMCGVWVALEDVGPDAGPLRLWPGSHLDAVGEPVDVTARTGDAVVWAADLRHGGAVVTDPTSTRWSQVTHWFRRDRVYISPSTSDLDAERYMVRDQVVDIATGRRVRPTRDGRPVVLEHGPGGLSRLHVAPGPVERTRLRARDLARGAPTTRRWLAARTRRTVRRLRGRPIAS